MWERFQQACGELAAEAEADRRTFDKAGFVWSKIFGKTLPQDVDDAEPAHSLEKQ
jgi:coproporphyrinogen III oxidase